MTNSNLPKYTLTHNEEKQRWDLKVDGTNRVVKSFDTKADATSAGTLAKALGEKGGSVKIQKEDGKFQEERTYPRSSDPRSSKG